MEVLIPLAANATEGNYCHDSVHRANFIYHNVRDLRSVSTRDDASAILNDT